MPGLPEHGRCQAHPSWSQALLSKPGKLVGEQKQGLEPQQEQALPPLKPKGVLWRATKQLQHYGQALIAHEADQLSRPNRSCPRPLLQTVRENPGAALPALDSPVLAGKVHEGACLGLS